MYHVPWIALFSAKRWRLDVLTFLIKGFAQKVLTNLIFSRIHTLSLTWLGFIIAPLRYQNIPLGIKKFPPTETAP